MKVASLQFNPICENTYVVWDDTNECIVVDAGNSDERENARLKEFIDSRGLHPRMAVNTHGHFDHTLGVQFLKDTYGIPFALSGKDKFLLDNAARSSASRSAAPTCRAGTTRGSCVRSSNGSSRWATKRRSTPDTANRPRSATRASTTPSSWRCSTGR